MQRSQFHGHHPSKKRFKTISKSDRSFFFGNVIQHVHCGADYRRNSGQEFIGDVFNSFANAARELELVSVSVCRLLSAPTAKWLYLFFSRLFS